MEASDIEVGMVVCLIDMKLNAGAPSDVPVSIANRGAPFGEEAVVVAVQDPEKYPGKLIALCLKNEWSTAHECDGLVPMKHGWWARPEHIYTPEDRNVHAEAAAVWQKQLAAAKSIVEEYLK